MFFTTTSAAPISKLQFPKWICTQAAACLSHPFRGHDPPVKNPLS